MKTVTLTCDICERNIATTGNCVGYRLAVVNESIPSRGGPVTAMMKYPILERDYHLCSRKCLLEWAEQLVAAHATATAAKGR